MTSTQERADIHVLSSMATRESLHEIFGVFARQTSWRVSAESAGGVDVLKRVQAEGRVGASNAVDLIVLASASIDQLIAQGLLRADTRTDLANSGIGVAVKAGAPRTDIGSATALTDSVLAARSLGYSTGPSGTYILKMFESLGVYETVRQRIVQAPAGVPVATLIADGKVALGFQQMSELISAPGIELIGPLPAALQMMTIFSAAATVRAHNLVAIGELLRFMNSPEANAIKRRYGMDPVNIPASGAQG
jgi:molybdate transport system substrate-binding protein